MKILNRREPLILFAGDLLAFCLALWLSLALRYGSIPSIPLLYQHAVPFFVLFVFWVLAFFIAGLYEKHTLVFKGKLPALILNTQIINSFIAVSFFYLTPFFGITPKTILAMELVIFSLLIILWRIVLVPLFGLRQRENAIIIGAGPEMKELLAEVNGNERYNITFFSSVDLEQIDGIAFQEEVIEKVYSEGISSIVIDLKSEKSKKILPSLYNLIFSNIRFFDMNKVYEEIFERIPLSLLEYNWFLENISASPKVTYDFLKRVMDIAVSSVLGFISLVFYPFIWLAIKLDDGGDIFIIQERIGKNNCIVKILKFRTMSVDDGGEGDSDRDKKITRVGKYLRASRIDEFPQLWSVLKGDISLIGPRPELPKLANLYEEQISFYNIRHLIKPGLSGWAQLYQENPPKFAEDYGQTKTKLSYDLFYIKNRSLVLDIAITLKTIKILLSRGGR